MENGPREELNLSASAHLAIGLGLAALSGFVAYREISMQKDGIVDPDSLVLGAIVAVGAAIMSGVELYKAWRKHQEDQ